MIRCPTCNSDYVGVDAVCTFRGSAYVNINTLTVIEQPDEYELVSAEMEGGKTEFYCFQCNHQWEVPEQCSESEIG